MPATPTKVSRSNRRAIKLLDVIIVLSALVFFVWLLLPGRSGRELPPRAICASNQRGIGQGEAIYANENQNSFPIHYFFGADTPQEEDPAPIPTPESHSTP